MKKLISLIIAYLALNVMVFADVSEIRIYDIRLDENTRGEYDVIIPRVKGFKDEKFERDLNKKIEEDASKILRDFSEKAEDENSRLSLSYKVKLNDEIISLVLEREETLNGEKVRLLNNYINIDRKENKLIELGHIFKDSNYKEKLQSLSLGKIIDQNTKFYLDQDGSLTLVFNSYEKSKKDVEEVNLLQEDIKGLVYDRALVGLVFLEDEIDSDLKGDISAKIPVLKGLKDMEFQTKVNNKINEDVKANMDSLRTTMARLKKDQVEYKINYKIREFNHIRSIELNIYQYIDDKNYTTEKLYYNIDTKNMEILELGSLFKDETYINEINKLISKMIDENKNEYFNSDKKFKTIDKNHKFYIDDYGNTVIVFDENTIKDKDKGIAEFRISSYLMKDRFKPKYKDLGLRDPKKVIINGRIDYFKDYINISENGNILIPIDSILDEFGYKKEYKKEGKLINISKDGKKYSLSLGENNYKINDADIIFQDYAKSINGYIYVPSNYIDRVLNGKTYIVDGVLNIDLK